MLTLSFENLHGFLGTKVTLAMQELSVDKKTADEQIRWRTSCKISHYFTGLVHINETITTNPSKEGVRPFPPTVF
jgi:hypothetical protein